MIGSRDPLELGGEVLCLVMVETREALERVEEIAGTPGLDGIYVGPWLRAALCPRRGGIATDIRPLPTVDEAWTALRRALWAADRSRDAVVRGGVGGDGRRRDGAGVQARLPGPPCGLVGQALA